MSDDQREEFVLVLEFEKIGRAGKIKTALGFWYFWAKPKVQEQFSIKSI
jgi:hypothetical protein